MAMLCYALAGFVLIVALARKETWQVDVLVGLALPVVTLILLPSCSFFVAALQHPSTVDAALRHADLTLHLDGFALTRWLVRSGWYALVPPVYAMLPFIMAISWTVERSRLGLCAAVVGPLASIPFYLLVPAAGPVYAFAGFPNAGAHEIAVAFVHPRNCMPSMHVAWALLLVLNAREPIFRAGLLFYAVLMMLATVGCGEHYVIDVIAAIPFTFAVQQLSQRVFGPISIPHTPRIKQREPIHDPAPALVHGPSGTMPPTNRDAA
jgi:PAP2 superfamily